MFYGFRCNIHTARAIKIAVVGVGEVGNDKLRKYLISYSSFVFTCNREKREESETQLLNHSQSPRVQVGGKNLKNDIYMKKVCARLLSRQ